MSFLLRVGLLVILSILFILLFIGGATAGAALVDRVAGVVDGEVITYSDVQIEKMLQLAEADDQDDKEVLQGLIERKLLLREAEKFRITESEEDIKKIQQKLQEIKSLTGEDKFYQTLREYDLADSDILTMLKEKVIAEKFIDFRINFFVVISDDAIKVYYNGYRDEFGDRSLEEVYGQIKARLFEVESKRRLEDYLNQLRQRAKISVNL